MPFASRIECGAMTRGHARAFRGESGIAMPLTLIALVVLGALMIAFAVLAQSEPMIAANQHRGAVARALAVGRAVNGGVDPPANGVLAGSPYDGGTYFAIGGDLRLGGFTLKIT